MSVVVAGGTGFLGRHIVAALAAADCDPVSVSRGGVAPVPGVRTMAADVRSPAAVQDLLSSLRPRSLVFAVRSDIADDHQAAGAIAEAGEACGVDRVIVLSSAAVYGTQTASAIAAVKESDPRRGTSEYARSKIAIEDTFREATVTTTMLRVFNVTGPGEPPNLVVRSLLERIRGGEDPLTVSNAAASRDFIDVRDVATAVVKAVMEPAPWHAVNVCSGQSTFIGELAAQCIALMDADCSLVTDHTGDASLGDPGRALRWGWMPQYTLANSLADSVTEIRAAR